MRTFEAAHNQAASGNGAIAFRFHAEALRRAVPALRRSAKSHRNEFTLAWCFGLVAILHLSIGCDLQSRARNEVERFWQSRPTNGNPLELAGYDRAFAKSAAPTVIDSMIADLKGSGTTERFDTYALVAYYLPLESRTERLSRLQRSSDDEVARWASRFLQKFAEFDLDASRQK